MDKSALSGKCVLLCVSGGIAAYKSAEIASRLKKAGAKVRVVMTEHATRFIAPLTFESLTGNQVHISLFDFEWEIGHISLAKEADIVVIAPCTANVIGKLASGIADDLLTTTVMAATSPVLIAPAMNANMWRNAATRHNVELLAARGIFAIGPESGLLACGDEDIGRMSEPMDIVNKTEELLSQSADLEGIKVLVTAGPTREELDPVRYITNHSSGKMGYAIAQAAAARGAKVTLISGPVSLPVPPGVGDVINIVSTRELREQVLGRAPGCDIIIQAAAPSDFRPEARSEGKIKRDESGELALRLVPNPDIAAELGAGRREGQVIVAFAAETSDLIENARAKLKKKNADFVVANDVSRPDAGFNVDDNRITIVYPEGESEYALMSKRAAADIILDHAARALAGRP